MKKITLLSAAIAAIVASHSVQAAESITIDPSLKLTYKNFYWTGKDKAKGTNKTYRDEWVHGVIADFDTGYINDVLGVVMTAGFAEVIDAKDGIGYTSVAAQSLPTTYTQAQLDAREANGVAGVQQLYLKAKYTLGEVDLRADFGVKKRDYALTGNSGSRLLAASSDGFDFSATYKDLTVYGAHITGASNRNASTLSEDLTVNSKVVDNENGTYTKVPGDKLDYIQVLGADYELAGIGFNVEQMDAKDYLKKHFAMVDYTYDLGNDMSLYGDARYAQAKDGGNLLADNADGSNYKSSWINLNLQLNVGNAFAAVGYNKTKDNDWIDANADQGNTGVFNSTLSQWADYSMGGEKAYVFMAGYNFADLGLPGLTISGHYAEGDGADTYTNDFERSEWGTSVSYAFGGQLEGLAVKWAHWDYDMKGTKDVANATQEKVNEVEDRIYLTYTYAIF